MTEDLLLRDVRAGDLPILFEQQIDPEANHMAAFTAADPTDHQAFMAKWQKILADPTIHKQTIVWDGDVVGSVLCYQDAEFAKPEITYWIGRPYWGRGLATRAVRAFLMRVVERPVFARVARDNLASLRVLAKCGFVIVGEDTGFANARGRVIEEAILKLE